VLPINKLTHRITIYWYM